jgi:regulator of RNase E activity RraA
VNENDFEALRHLDTCTVSNAIETFQLRLRNTGFANSSVRCMFEDFPSMVGYAATARLRTEGPPVDSSGFHDRSDWWRSILDVPPPRIVVLEDMDKPPGRGAFVGDVHAAILLSLGCAGFVTDGAVRELPGIRELGLQLFAGNVAVSHCYAHIFHFGTVVNIGGLEVHPGDLLHGDRHGLLSIPSQVAGQVAAVGNRLREKERKLIALCRSDQMSVDRLREITRTLE